MIRVYKNGEELLSVKAARDFEAKEYCDEGLASKIADVLVYTHGEEVLADGGIGAYYGDDLLFVAEIPTAKEEDPFADWDKVLEEIRIQSLLFALFEDEELAKNVYYEEYAPEDGYNPPRPELKRRR